MFNNINYIINNNSINNINNIMDNDIINNSNIAMIAYKIMMDAPVGWGVKLVWLPSVTGWMGGQMYGCMH